MKSKVRLVWRRTKYGILPFWVVAEQTKIEEFYEEIIK